MLHTTHLTCPERSLQHRSATGREHDRKRSNTFKVKTGQVQSPQIFGLKTQKNVEFFN